MNKYIEKILPESAATNSLATRFARDPIYESIEVKPFNVTSMHPSTHITLSFQKQTTVHRSCN